MRKKMSLPEAIDAINAAWAGESMTHTQLFEALEASGKEEALDQLVALKKAGNIVGHVSFDEETGLSHVYTRGD